MPIASPGADLALHRPVHTNENRDTASHITDGDPATRWCSVLYPAYAQIDLEGCFHLTKVVVHTPAQGASLFDVYASLDGVDFTRIAQKMEELPCPPEGEAFEVDCEARFLRVRVTYNSASDGAILCGIEAYGEPSGQACEPAAFVPPADFEQSAYHVPITQEDTLREVRELIAYTVGEARADWFTLRLAENERKPGRDYFILSNETGKIAITGRTGVCLAVGFHHYLKYFCNAHVSQMSMQVNLPEAPVPVGEIVRRETPFQTRYSYNYCTLSYTMAFWGEAQWKRELYWLAMNGVNLVLDITAQEEVWRRFLGALGYSHMECKDFIAGPAYYAWAYMANISGFGGPVHDNWFAARTRLARRNHLMMRRLGMQPVLQGYSGMAPSDINQKVPDAKVISQGLWNGFPRPAMLKTTTDAYRRLAQLFYRCQREVFGDVSHYYATDPFHEGGRNGGMSPKKMARFVLDEMLKNDPESVWVIQSWGENPSKSLLQGLRGRKEHALVLDLYAEARPHWETWAGGEFDNTPWLWCMLNNFGGRMGLNGHMDTVASEVARAANTAKYMAGIGITPEATFSNPVLFDLFFETVWSDTPEHLPPIEPDMWLAQYVRRRYGAESEAAMESFRLLRKTVYNPSLNHNGEGAPESVVNARPAFEIRSASSWGTAVIGYDKHEFERAVRLLLEDYDALKQSDGYLFDLADCLKQVLSNTAQEYHHTMVQAYREKNLTVFDDYSARFFQLISLTEQVLGTRREFLLGTWLRGAQKLAEEADDFTRDLYEFNARALITTWGAIRQANEGGLRDYSNKQWAGLTHDFYRPRWEKWIALRRAELTGGQKDRRSEKEQAEDWFHMEWKWVLGRNPYPAEVNGLDLKELAQQALAFSF
ncbi:MAG: alpha-N-acetylglucosaminidase C-terminal domain-containing protein [Clostridiales bacterium]|nr:alpha-N-acetylglucosaminidase C-terminal domain-containing protein [Clostridiales bacterium]